MKLARAAALLAAIGLALVAAGCDGSARVSVAASKKPLASPFTRKLVACQRTKKLICDPSAYRRDRVHGDFPLSTPDPPGARHLGLRQVLPSDWRGARYGAELMTYRRATRVAHGLAGFTRAVVDPGRKVWVLTRYYDPPVAMSTAGLEIMAGETMPATIRVRYSSEIVDALTGGAIDSCDDCRAVPAGHGGRAG